MATWFLENGLYLLGVALVPVVGLLLVYWSLWGDRSKGRSRCPKCWYDMRGTLPRLQCPECGHDARWKRRLYRNHRRWGRVVVGAVLVLIFSYPLAIVGGYWRERAAMWRYGITPPQSDIYARNAIPPSYTTVGPNGLVYRLPYEFARFFERLNALYVDHPAKLP